VIPVDEPDLSQIGNWRQLHFKRTFRLDIAKQDQSGRATGSHHTMNVIKAAMRVTKQQDHP